MNKEFDEKYLEIFKECIWDASSTSEIENMLPKDTIDGFLELNEYFAQCAREEIEYLTVLMEQAKDEEDRSYLEEQILKNKQRLELFDRKVEEKKKQEKEEMVTNMAVSLAGRDIIYLKSSAGNVLFESDLKDIDAELLPGMEELFDFLRHGDFTSDQTKYRSLTNNSCLSNAREVKSFKLRIHFINAGPNIIMVYLGNVKKADNPKKEKNTQILRCGKVEEYLKKLKPILSDPEKRDEFLSEEAKITDRIEQFLSSKKRGIKHE